VFVRANSARSEPWVDFRLSDGSRSNACIDDAVQAEVPKVLAQLAPRGESPDVAPEIQAEWAHLPLSGPGAASSYSRSVNHVRRSPAQCVELFTGFGSTKKPVGPDS